MFSLPPDGQTTQQNPMTPGGKTSSNFELPSAYQSLHERLYEEGASKYKIRQQRLSPHHRLTQSKAEMQIGNETSKSKTLISELIRQQPSYEALTPEQPNFVKSVFVETPSSEIQTPSPTQFKKVKHLLNQLYVPKGSKEDPPIDSKFYAMNHLRERLNEKFPPDDSFDLEHACELKMRLIANGTGAALLTKEEIRVEREKAHQMDMYMHKMLMQQTAKDAYVRDKHQTYQKGLKSLQLLQVRPPSNLAL